jgi:hypothetical protein
MLVPWYPKLNAKENGVGRIIWKIQNKGSITENSGSLLIWKIKVYDHQYVKNCELVKYHLILQYREFPKVVLS